MLKPFSWLKPELSHVAYRGNIPLVAGAEDTGTPSTGPGISVKFVRIPTEQGPHRPSVSPVEDFIAQKL
jgi:hypothetical protein